MKTFQPVRFEGTWTATEQTLIETAAETTESAAATPATAALRGSPWACCRVARGADVFYLAHWRHRPGVVLRAASADELALQMFTV